YDKDLILNYNKFYLDSYLKRNFITITAISLVFIVYMLIKQEWKYAILLFGILVLYLVMTFFMQKLTTKRILKRSPLVEQPVLQTYVFKDDIIEVTNIKTYMVGYDSIVKFKKATLFYMMQSKDRKTFIIDKEGFDSLEDKELFESVMTEKYGKKRRI
ncbi:MAG TPA: YcxB family protein, partial [Bacillota bacterium]|nr:YcxB family protein [Bacillota bacterium]